MGGGTPLLEANRLGCDVTGIDVNPMSYWIVREELQRIDLDAYKEASKALLQVLESKAGYYYRTSCVNCGISDARVKYFLWIKSIPCRNCNHSIDLFNGHLVAKNTRHPTNVFVCGTCGGLNEKTTRSEPGKCGECSAELRTKGPAMGNRCPCPSCGVINSYPDPDRGPPRHRMFGIEYHCDDCSRRVKGRLFKQPTEDDLARFDHAKASWLALTPTFAPDGEIPAGDETNRLHRWGYRRYAELFNERQLLGLELICRQVASIEDTRLKCALATNLSDLLRYQNMLCRYDTMALKSLDIFSIHGYPVGLVQCESNILGIPRSGPRAGNVGSGGWSNITDKYLKAKIYCEQPFEIEHQGRQKKVKPIFGEWIGQKKTGLTGDRERKIDLHCADSAQFRIEAETLDAILTDPPYYSNVQYAELMDFCYVWLRRLVKDIEPTFGEPTTRSPNELTGNITMERGIDNFSEGISQVFRQSALALKSGSPFVFTYHHNAIQAYIPIIIGLLDAGLVCTVSLPCPSEMGGSIHIKGTGSSRLDSIFVCRTTGTVRRNLIVDQPKGIDNLVRAEAALLRSADLRVTSGDIRCIAFGHIARLSVWNLRNTWNKESSIKTKFSVVEDYITKNFNPSVILRMLESASDTDPEYGSRRLLEPSSIYTVKDGEIPF